MDYLFLHYLVTAVSALTLTSCSCTLNVSQSREKPTDSTEKGATNDDDRS